METYIVFNGRKIVLSPELEAQLVNMKVIELTPSDRVPTGCKYFFVDDTFGVSECVENGTYEDSDRYECGNYSVDYESVCQRSMHMELNSRLWKFSASNAGASIGASKFCISYNTTTKMWWVSPCGGWKPVGSVCFVSKEVAEDAIQRVVIPFCNRYSDFDPSLM